MDASRALELARKYDACSEAIEWLESLPPDADAWQKCERADWMLWFAARYGVDRKLIITAGCRCARLALPYLPTGEDRPRIAIETAEAWTRGEATIEQVRAAAYAVAASAAAYAAYVADVVYAEDAVAYAAYAAANAAYAADVVARAAYAAARAAYAPDVVADVAYAAYAPDVVADVAYAAYAPDVVADVAYAAYAAYALKEAPAACVAMQKQCADVVREIITII